MVQQIIQFQIIQIAEGWAGTSSCTTQGWVADLGDSIHKTLVGHGCEKKHEPTPVNVSVVASLWIEILKKIQPLDNFSGGSINFKLIN